MRFLGEGVDPHRKAGVIARTSLDADSPYADAAVHGDGLISLQFRRTKGAHDGGGPPRGQGGRRRPAREEGKHPHPLGGPVRRAVHDQPGRGPRPGRRRVRGAVPVLAQPRRGGERRLPRRAPRPPGPRGLRSLPGLHREPPRDPRRADREPAGGPQLRGALRGAELDAGRARAHLQHLRPFRGPGAAPPLRPRHEAVVADRHRHRRAEQQRPRPLVRRRVARHQRPDRRRRPVGRLHRFPPPAGRRSGSRAKHPRTSTAGRRTAGPSSTPAGGTASSTSTGSPRTGRARRRTSPATRGSTTGRSTRRTGGTSTSTRPAAARCRSGG